MTGPTRELTYAGARVAVVLVVLLLAVVGVATAGPELSLARMTDTDQSGTAAVSSGEVALSLSNGAASGTWTGTDTLGPTQTGYYRVRVSNTGTVGLRYAVTATATSDVLASRLQAGVAVLTAGTSTCSAATYGVSPSSSNTGPTVPFGSTTGVAVLGDPATGADPGDQVLGAAAYADLCLRVSLPHAAGLGYAARGTTTATTTFTFTGEST